MTSADIWDEYPLVFHYTSQTALASILRSQSLQATHYKFLNDSREVLELLPDLVTILEPRIEHALSNLASRNAKVMEEITKRTTLKNVAKRDAEVIARALYRATYEGGDRTSIYEPFIISFCGHVEDYEKQNGLLSQWRAYGRDGGFAIAFDTKHLSEVIVREAEANAYLIGHFSDVVYAGDPKRLANEFADFDKELVEYTSKMYSSTAPSPEKLATPFLNSTTRFKHRGFREENEVRIVLAPVTNWLLEHFRKEEQENFEKIKDKAVKDISIRDNLAPYITIRPKEPQGLPIKYIIVGPDAKRAERADKLRKVIQFLGLKIEVKISELPLV